MNIDFSEYATQLDAYKQLREEMIKQSRDTLALAKKTIFILQRRDGVTQVDFAALDESFQKIVSLSHNHPQLPFEGSFNEACQEYVEAKVFAAVLLQSVMPSARELQVSVDNYLQGICDVTGEMVRKAVQYVIDSQLENIIPLVETGDAIYEQLLEFSFKNGGLRKKFDAVKYNVEKLHRVQYDVAVKQ